MNGNFIEAFHRNSIGLTNALKWYLLFTVEYENHVCSNTKARASQRIYVHLVARRLPSWRRGDELLI
jgi:hypothetical protein